MSSSDDEVMTHRSLPPTNSTLNNNKQRPSLRKSSGVVSSVTVMNNLHQRPRSAPHGPLPVETVDRLKPESDSSLLTSTEKKDLVKNFIKQFLEDNPDAVLDTQLMAGLSEKAKNLIERSFD